MGVCVCVCAGGGGLTNAPSGLAFESPPPRPPRPPRPPSHRIPSSLPKPRPAADPAPPPPPASQALVRACGSRAACERECFERVLVGARARLRSCVRAERPRAWCPCRRPGPARPGPARYTAWSGRIVQRRVSKAVGACSSQRVLCPPAARDLGAAGRRRRRVGSRRPPLRLLPARGRESAGACEGTAGTVPDIVESLTRVALETKDRS